MCGSGTTLRVAAEHGLQAVGFDIDPLAQKISTVLCTSFSEIALAEAAATAESFNIKECAPLAIECEETRKFIDFWFAPTQKEHLLRLSSYLLQIPTSPIRDLLFVALSRTIITKFRGASLAWDVSHSRPHRKKVENDYDVRSGFQTAVRNIIKFHQTTRLSVSADVRLGDARMSSLEEKADLILTSPPYLNAIDYMRGHRLSLVWMGYTIPALRKIRSSSIGTEKSLKSECPIIDRYAKSAIGANHLPVPQNRIFHRYIQDSENLMSNIGKQLKPGGKLILVVANSAIRDVPVEHNKMFREIGRSHSLDLISENTRDLPNNRRYLPAKSGNGSLEKRMKTEHILEFQSIA
jgi:SAM-dependent methyltransferase